MEHKKNDDEADVRGEHSYPADKPEPQDAATADELPERTHYAAGADGTQKIPKPENAGPRAATVRRNRRR